MDGSPFLDLPRWFDLHAHFRQGPNVSSYIGDHLRMGCAGALAMPNTRPPVSRVSGENRGDAWSVQGYRAMLADAGGDAFEQLIVPLYLTRSATAREIEQGVGAGMLQAAKYYPPHGTTNADHGVPMDEWIGGDVFRAMEEAGVVLCIHGEAHGLSGPDYFDASTNAEEKFYAETMPRLREAHPGLRIVCEHITTAAAAAFVQGADEGTVGATVTPQHLLFTVGHLLQGFRFHLYCLPLVKFERDRAALREAVRAPGQRRFFAGTDSAPHTEKMTSCGCAAGCYTGGVAPQLYARAFEEAGCDLSSEAGGSVFGRFLCENGPAFYGFPASKEHFRLERRSSSPATLNGPAGDVVTLAGGMEIGLDWSLA